MVINRSHVMIIILLEITVLVSDVNFSLASFFELRKKL